MIKKISLLCLLFLGTSLQAEELNKKAQALVAFAEYMYACKEAQRFETKLYLKRRDATDLKLAIINYQRDGLFVAVWDAFNAIEENVKSFKNIQDINPNDLADAQQEVPWLQEPIAEFIMHELANNNTLIPRCYDALPDLWHVHKNLKPYAQEKDADLLEVRLIRQEDHQRKQALKAKRQ